MSPPRRTPRDQRASETRTLGDLLYADDTKARVPERHWIGLVQSIEEDRALMEAGGSRQNVIEGNVEYGPSGIDSPDDEKKPPMLTPPPEGDKPSTTPKTAPAPAPKTEPKAAPAPKGAP